MTESIPAKERLLASGAELFAESGFAGVSVRQICASAGTGINMIHHYFGSKEGLLEAIVERYSTRIFAVPMRLLEKAPLTKDDFVSRIEMLFETTLEAYIEQRALMLVVVREQADLSAVEEYARLFVAFLDQAKKRGFVRKELDSEMITGAMLDRILNQVQFAPWLKKSYGVNVLGDTEYRQHWCRSNIDLFLYGLVDGGPNET